LRDRLKKTREDVVVAHALQNHLDATVQHLIESDPREAVSALHDKLGETEQRALLQQGRNESTDMHDQLAEIRRRQQGVRDIVGKVADQRRAVEPVFTEIRDRQNQLERSLHDLETDDRKNNLADRLKDIARDVSTLLSRVGTVQDTFATLNQYKEDLAKSHAELMPLRASDAGLNALIGELGLSHERLAKSVDELETGGEAPLGTRVETLSKNKIEIEQRLARVDDSFHILKGIGLDFEELRLRQAQLERSLAGVETDADGKTLADRQNALNEFVLQSRQRLGALQETLATLNAFKTELSKSQADLVPLKAPVFGIEALITDVGTTRDLLAKTVGEIEASGDVTLASRVDALTRSKREVEDRLARVFDNFNALDGLRKDIGGIFSTIRNSLNRIG
jgi:DNA repair exonuclease SbcCD ATPase subunit